MAFATPEELQDRLGVTFDNAGHARARALLDDATAYLQAELGQLVEAGTATFTTYLDDCAGLMLPQHPIRAVSAVLVDGVAVTGFELIDGRVHLVGVHGYSGRRRTVTVTFDYGYTVVPQELKAWACVLASQMIASVDAGGSLGASAVAAEQLGPESVTYVTDGTPMGLPADVLERLRARYGTAVYVTS